MNKEQLIDVIQYITKKHGGIGSGELMLDSDLLYESMANGKIISLIEYYDLYGCECNIYDAHYSDEIGNYTVQYKEMSESVLQEIYNILKEYDESVLQEIYNILKEYDEKN